MDFFVYLIKSLLFLSKVVINFKEIDVEMINLVRIFIFLLFLYILGGYIFVVFF